jgi:CHAD domain-containing protein
MMYQIGRNRKAKDPDSVHDLRVSIRRLGACLTVFEQFFPKKASKRIRSRFREAMALAGEVRDRDIAIELATEAGLRADGELIKALVGQRRAYSKELGRLLKRWGKSGVSEKWRAHLCL